MRRLSLARTRLWWERAFWVIPTAAVLLAFPLRSVTTSVDEWLHAGGLAGELSPGGATTLPAAIRGGMITFTGFVFSFVILILQFGSSQYSPRTVPYFMRARSLQWILAIFLLTITYSFLTLLEIGSLRRADFTADAGVYLAVFLLVASLIGFIQLPNVVGSRVRVDGVVNSLGRQSRRMLQRRYAAWDPARATGAEVPAVVPSHPDQVDELTAHHAGPSGQVIAITPAPARRVARRLGPRSLSWFGWATRSRGVCPWLVSGARAVIPAGRCAVASSRTWSAPC